MTTKDWLKIVGAAALAMTGAGLAGAGPLAASLGGTAATAGATGTAAATGAGAAGAAGAAAGAGAAGSTAATAGALGKLSPMIGKMLVGQGAGLGLATAKPKYDITPPGQAPDLQSMDLNALVAQNQQRSSQLPKLQLGLRRNS